MTGKRRYLAPFIAAVALASFPAAANEAVGGFLGAIAGGILGNQIGEGAGRVFATGVGAMIGAQAGSAIGRSMEYGDDPYSYGYRPRYYGAYGYSFGSYGRPPRYSASYTYYPSYAPAYGAHRSRGWYGRGGFETRVYYTNNHMRASDASFRGARGHRAEAVPASLYRTPSETNVASAELYRRDVPGVIGDVSFAPEAQGYAMGPSQSIYVTPYGYPVQ